MHCCATQKMRNIHVGCCLFSHKPKINKKQKQHRFVALTFGIDFLFFVCSNITTCTVVQRKRRKKCGAHTHVHHLSRISLSQYSRRLLSILAQPTTEGKHTKTVVPSRRRYLPLYLLLTSSYYSLCTVVH